MAKNNKKNGVVELWGHEFKKAGEGLDKSAVVSFVDELMEKHEALLKRAEHLSSLTKLAEKTIVEADNVAQQVQSEAEEQAKAEAKAILSEAEEQAQKLIEEKRAEALARVNREVEAIKDKAQQQAEAMLEEKTKEIQPELRNNIKRLYGELLTQLDNLKEQVVELEKELDQKLSQPSARTSTVEEPVKVDSEEPGKVDSEEPVKVDSEEPGKVDSEEPGKVNSEEPVKVNSEEPGKVNMEAGKVDNEFLELIRPANETDEAEPEWELEILPPIDLTQILDIINHLDSLAEVEQTELIPQMDKPTITVFLRQSIDLVDILRTLPQVASVTEDKTGGGEGKPRKAQIELSGKTVTQQSN
jgi:F0F1-type ATP synthase membrane subunit b/b'